MPPAQPPLSFPYFAEAAAYLRARGYAYSTRHSHWIAVPFAGPGEPPHCRIERRSELDDATGCRLVRYLIVPPVPRLPDAARSAGA